MKNFILFFITSSVFAVDCGYKQLSICTFKILEKGESVFQSEKRNYFSDLFFYDGKAKSILYEFDDVEISYEFFCNSERTQNIVITQNFDTEIKKVQIFKQNQYKTNFNFDFIDRYTLKGQCYWSN